MFQVSHGDLSKILQDFQIFSPIKDRSELQRYHYERENPASKEVRLILRVALEDGSSLVVRLKNENDVTIGLLEQQCRFADCLRKNGIPTPKQYASDGHFAKWYCIGLYDVIVTVEEFVQNEVTIVDLETARKTGTLLARTHDISEKYALHVHNPVLFDPFSSNDLFDYHSFAALKDSLDGENLRLHSAITEQYNRHMQALAPLQAYPRFAVQGDLSDGNLYHAEAGEIGLFDFNRAGDNILFCDAIMQAVFEARLMCYPQNAPADFEAQVFSAFLDGYTAIRPFSEAEQRWLPTLWRVIDAFWSSDIRWNDDSLLHAFHAHDPGGVHRWLTTILRRLEDGPFAP